MVLNIFLMITILLSGDVEDLNNYIEIGLWAAATVGLLTMRKWGGAFAIVTLAYTLSTSVGIIIYFGVWVNAIRVAINIPVIIYLFYSLFKGKFR
jgi:uncharacterized membrane protein (DUF2068 family)